MKVIIADSSTLITLLDTKHFSLLFELFTQICIAEEVYLEITYKYKHKKIIDKYLSLKKLQRHTVTHNDSYEMLSKRLDKGEVESIVLAQNMHCPLIIDERKGRSIAKSMGIDIIGLIGIILKLLEKSIIDKQKAIHIIEAVEKNDFRLSNGLKEMVYSY